MKKLVVFLTFILAVMVFTVAVSAADISVEANDGRVFSVSGTRSLPSYVSPTDVKIVYDGTKSVSYKNKNGESVSLASGDVLDLTPYKLAVESGKVTYRLPVTVNGKTSTLAFYFADNLSSVHITTTQGRDNIISSNGKDTETKITVINKDGSYEYSDTEETFSEFKVRGNTTKDYAKKPFQIKLGTKTDMFGMGKSKTWILLANYLDQSNIRNAVMYAIAAMLGMDACDFTFVDLYIDGEYYGVFFFCEKVQIGSGRVDIFDLEDATDELNESYNETNTVVSTGIENTIITEYAYIDGVVNPEDITGGYIIELDNNYWSGELCYFKTENGNAYVVKSPEYASKEQVEYIATLFGEMEEAIMSPSGYNRLGKHYSDYADVDSFVYAYIVAEFSRNYDAGSSSMYFYKDADKDGEFSKIVKGPLWDCDNTLGNILKNGAANPEGYWARGRRLWVGLTQHDEFNARVTEVFAEYYDEIFDMIDVGGFISQQVSFLGQSIHMERARWHSDDYAQWPFYYFGIHYDRWQSSQVFNFVDGYYSYNNDKDSSTVIGYLCEHMEARLNWLATEWGCDVTLRERVVDAEALTEKIFTFKGYSFSFNGRMAVGYDINYDLLERYETVTGISLEIGVVFAGYDNLGGKNPLDENGEAIVLEKGKVIKAVLNEYGYAAYDFLVTDITDEIKDVKLVISAYIVSGANISYIQGKAPSSTVTGVSYNEIKGA